MLEKPALADETLIACLREHYAISAAHITFLPIGNDATAWVYRAEGEGGERYFLKLKKGVLNEASLLVPRYLRDAGLAQVVAPLPAITDRLWAEAAGFTLIVYPFIVGEVAMEAGLSQSQWVTLGAVLRQLHSVRLPAELAARVRRETFIPQWSVMVRTLQAKIDAGDYAAPVERELAAFWQEKQAEIAAIVQRAEALGQRLQEQAGVFVLCHADIHTANVLLDASGGLHIVDWDEVLFAPKERDLVFVGADNAAEGEAAFFFNGYGDTTIDRVALAYYRYEWVVQELGDFGERVFLTKEAGDDTRADALRGFRQLFDPGDVVEGAQEAWHWT